jgi:hypothetical protein
MARLQRLSMSYIAGLFDGEGCIRYHASTPHAFITSCYPHHLAMIQRDFGFGTFRSLKSSRAGRKSAYRLEFYGDNAIKFITAIRPFLIEKGYQADIMLSIRELPKRSSIRTSLMYELSAAKKINYGL